MQSQDKAHNASEGRRGVAEPPPIHIKLRLSSRSGRIEQQLIGVRVFFAPIHPTPRSEAAPASAPLPSHHDQRPGHSRSARRRTTAAMALRTPAMANAGPGSDLMKMPPVLQRTAQSTRSTTAWRRVAIPGLLLSPRRGQSVSRGHGRYADRGRLMHGASGECSAWRRAVATSRQVSGHPPLVGPSSSHKRPPARCSKTRPSPWRRSPSGSRSRLQHSIATFPGVGVVPRRPPAEQATPDAPPGGPVGLTCGTGKRYGRDACAGEASSHRHGPPLVSSSPASNVAREARQCLPVRRLWQVVYLSPADNSAGPVWSCPRDVNRTIRTAHLGSPRPSLGHLLCP